MNEPAVALSIYPMPLSPPRPRPPEANPMKTIPRPASLLLALTALLATAPALLADETDPAAEASFKPKEYDLSRYSKNFDKKSPFEFDPPPVETVVTEDIFKDVSLGGYCGSGNTM